jgi:hypothetical protein
MAGINQIAKLGGRMKSLILALLLMATPAFAGDYTITLSADEEAVLAQEAAERKMTKDEIVQEIVSYIHDVLSSHKQDQNKKALENMSPAAKAQLGLK